MLPEHVLGEVPPADLANHEFFRAPTVGMGPFTFTRWETWRRRHAVYEEVTQLAADGVPIKEIVRRLGLARGTVRKLIRGGAPDLLLQRRGAAETGAAEAQRFAARRIGREPLGVDIEHDSARCSRANQHSLKPRARSPWHSMPW